MCEIRTQANGVIVGGEHGVVLIQRAQYAGAHAVDVGVIRLQRDGAIEIGQCGMKLSRLRISGAAVDQRREVTGHQLDHPVVTDQRFLVLPVVEEGVAAAEVGVRMYGRRCRADIAADDDA